MGKTGRVRKRLREQRHLLRNHHTVPSGQYEHLVDSTDVSITLKVLAAMQNNMALARSPSMKSIRRALYSVLQSIDIASNANDHGAKSISGRIGDALHDGHWSDALLLLERLQETPRLGALQRWIRDLFLHTHEAVSPDTVAALLDSILRACGQKPVSPTFKDGDTLDPSSAIEMFPMWCAFPLCSDKQPSCLVDWEVPNFKVLAEEKAWREGMKLFYIDGSDGSAATEDILCPRVTSDPNPIVRVDVPFVDGAFVLGHVLSDTECARVIETASKMGFTPDASYSLSSVHSPSAAGVVWVAEKESLCIFDRVRQFLPASINGHVLKGINPRWRVYSYATGATYRPHIDGAWTYSAIRDGKYCNDLYEGGQISRYTFLVYLNEDFSKLGRVIHPIIFSAHFRLS